MTNASDGSDVRSDIECDSGPYCQAVEHTEGCFATMRKAWEKDNLCGACPYREALREANERLREALQRIATETSRTTSADGTWDEPAFDFRARAVARKALASDITAPPS